VRVRFFNIGAMYPTAGEEALNAFLASHRVLTVEKHFVPQAGESYWSVCVSVIDGGVRSSGSGGAKRERIDYREVLTDADFAVYASLRGLRKTMAEAEGVPPYALFTNEQLAEMVTRRILTLAAMGEIDGVGKARLEKYGEAFLALLTSSFAKSNPQPP